MYKPVSQGTPPSRRVLAKGDSIGVCPLDGRVSYASRKAAKRSVDRMTKNGQARDQKPGYKLHAYQCDHCQDWHTGFTLIAQD